MDVLLLPTYIHQCLLLFGQVSNMLVPVEVPKRKVEISLPVLLALYEAVHLNRNFITILTHVGLTSSKLCVCCSALIIVCVCVCV